MKYAFMTFSAAGLQWPELLKLASDLGYEGVEPRVESEHGHGVEIETDKTRRRELFDRAQEAGVSVCCIATGLKFCDAKPQNLLDTARRYIELAADLGCPTLRVFGGALPEGMEREKAIDLVAANMRQLAADAQQANVALCLETHDSWVDPKHVREVMLRADHSAVAVNWDMMHPTFAAGYRVEEGFECLRPWIRHVHIHDGFPKDGLSRFASCGEGELDMKATIRVLLDSDYQGFISGEWIDVQGNNPIDIADELIRMRALEASLKS